jgi:hypothetical protein
MERRWLELQACMAAEQTAYNEAEERRQRPRIVVMVRRLFTRS